MKIQFPLGHWRSNILKQNAKIFQRRKKKRAKARERERDHIVESYYGFACIDIVAASTFLYSSEAL